MDDAFSVVVVVIVVVEVRLIALYREIEHI